MLLKEAWSLSPGYIPSGFNPDTLRLDALDNKVGYVTAHGGHYTSIHGEDGRSYILDSKKTTYIRPTKKEREEWVENAKKKMRCLPFATGKEHYHGNDPEVFMLDDKGQLIPAFAFLPSKQDAKEQDAAPGYVGGRGSFPIKRKMFWDGFQAEFTTPASQCFGWAADYIHHGLKELTKAARVINKNAKPTWKPVVELTRELLDTSPPQCVALGCDPSLNAYFEGPNPTLADIDVSNLMCRFAGYHIHFGIGSDHKPSEYANIIKMLDAVAGVASVCLFRGMEDPRRRQYYGLAGEYRLPPHGLEWRTLSSCVLCSPYTFHLMSDLARGASQLHMYKLSGFWKYKEAEVVKAINELDVDLAWKILEDNKDALKLLLRGIYVGSSGGGDSDAAYKKVMTLLEKGALNTLDTDIESSWGLNKDWKSHSNDNQATIYYMKL